MAHPEPEMARVMAQIAQPDMAQGVMQMDKVLDDLKLVRPDSRHLSVGALLAVYEKLAAQGDKAAALRVEMLRRKLAEPQGTTP
jgi:hypothetical protein